MNRILLKHFTAVIKDSFRFGGKEFLKSFKSLWGWLVGSCGALYSTKDKLFADIDENTAFLHGRPIIKGLIFVVIALFLLLLFFISRQFFIQSWRRYILIKRESVYGNAIVLLAEGYARIHKNRGKKLSIDEVKVILSEFCDKLREIYQFKTKSKCSASIKIIVDLKIEGNGINFDTRVVNLIRDSNCKKRYNEVAYNSIEHNIANNTCYERIISKFFSNKYDEMFFLSNDIPSISEYENSSFQLFPDYTLEVRSDEKTRRKEYPLGYRSELVVSITPSIKDKMTTFPILGFLCVDCVLEKKEVFNSKYDVPLLQGVADGLYDFIKFNLYNNK